MIFPNFFGGRFKPFESLIPNTVIMNIAVSLSLVFVTMGGGFIMYGITLNSLQIYSKDNFSLVSMLPEDSKLLPLIADDIEKYQTIGRLELLNKNNVYLGYVMPVDYVMQGMIADTSESFHLFKEHHAVNLINDWILHPFQHLRASPVLSMAKMRHVDPMIVRGHMCPLGINNPSIDCNNCPYRRVIFTELQNNSNRIQGKQILGYNTVKVPVFYADVDTRTGSLINLKAVKKAAAWENVPTPAY